MQTNIKVTVKDFGSAESINNRKSVLKSKNQQLTITTRIIAMLTLFLVLGITLVASYTKSSPMFWPLLKGSIIITMVAFIANKSSNTFKNS